MRIRSVQARGVIAPLDPPIRTAAGQVTQAPNLLIDLTTDEGVVGRAYLFGYHAFTLGPLRDLVVALGEGLTDEALAPVELDRAMRARLALFGTRGLQGMAVAGIDMAAWDARAVAAGLPLATLLGGRPRPIVAYNSLGMIPPAEAADAAVKTAAAGFKAMKVKIGWPTLAEDLAVIRAARKINLTYRDEQDRATTRTIWPFAVGYHEAARLLVGWCELRQDFRSFRTDRIDAAAFLDERYPERPARLRARWRQLNEAKYRMMREAS